MLTYVGLLGGLALFLYGMQMMSEGLEATAGNKMKQILEKLTANRFLGVFVGAVVTAIIQSSSATTVMVVGFVNSGMMTIRQAVWIIMGANIGTTITGQLIALDVGAVAPLIAFAGVVMVVFLKNPKIHHIGNILAGLGILFIGMDMMSGSMKPLANNETFVELLTKFENPFLGILAGTVFTAILQSSSASVGILQALADNNVIGLASAVYVLFGQNIGTCVTSLLASMGMNSTAKRVTVVHISFNVIGTIMFTLICMTTPMVSFVEGLTPGRPSAQIANMHTIFNVVTTVALLPFGMYLARFAERLLKDKRDENDKQTLYYIQNIKNINEEKLGASAISMEGTKKEILRMLDLAKDNVLAALQNMLEFDEKRFKAIEENEECIDYLNREISKYITKVITHERTESGSKIFNAYFTITSNIERIGDHAVNIGEYSDMINNNNISFSDKARAELMEVCKVSDEMLRLLCNVENNVVTWHARIAAMEQRIDDMTKEYRNNMYARIRDGVCKDEGSILYSDLLTDFERIGDHCLNISDEIMSIAMENHE